MAHHPPDPDDDDLVLHALDRVVAEVRGRSFLPKATRAGERRRPRLFSLVGYTIQGLKDSVRPTKSLSPRPREGFFVEVPDLEPELRDFLSTAFLLILPTQQSLLSYFALSFCMDRALAERHLAIVERHVAAGERYVASQSEIVAELAGDGLDVKTSLDVLTRFEEILARQIAQRNRIRADLAVME